MRKCSYCDNEQTRYLVTNIRKRIELCSGDCVVKAVDTCIKNKEQFRLTGEYQDPEQVQKHTESPPDYQLSDRWAWQNCDGCAFYNRRTDYCSLYQTTVRSNYVCSNWVEFQAWGVPELEVTEIQETISAIEDLVEKFVKQPDENQSKSKRKLKWVIKDIDEERHYLSGPVLVPDEFDLQEDIVYEDTIEKAAHDFLKMYREIDSKHERVGIQAALVESNVLKSSVDYYGDGEVLEKGTWLITVEVWGDVWKQVQSGELTGFSIDGTALVEAV